MAKANTQGRLWRFFIDRGGTFTDCIGIDPQGKRYVTKVLSSDEAPMIAIRNMLGLRECDAIPPCIVRIGTTVATNALLERRGAKTAMLITRGFRDLLSIGDQTRPSLFDLDIRKPPALYVAVAEVNARCDARGNVLDRPSESELRAALAELRSQADSLAIVFLHSHANGELEQQAASLARQAGFLHIVLSHQADNQVGLLGRGDTSVVDAYLTPCVQQYVAYVERAMPRAAIQWMQSSGGLATSDRFSGKNAVLSGPAGGVIACKVLADTMGLGPLVGLDMGGTSTDVCRVDGEIERSYETEVAGVRLRVPMTKLHTVAAGGGSICRDNGFRLQVGPDSAGATPGPICYGHPNAESLTITDANVYLGRVVGDRFAVPLLVESIPTAIDAIRVALAQRNEIMTREEVAAGFVRIATASMAEAVRKITIAAGHDVRESTLVVFGGAGGQHVCALCRELGIDNFVIDADAGVFSAAGIGAARPEVHVARDLGAAIVTPGAPLAPDVFAALESAGRAELALGGSDTESVEVVHRADLRYRGTDTTLTMNLATTDVLAAFAREYRAHFGYSRDEEIEAVVARVEVRGPPPSPWRAWDAAPSHAAVPLRAQRTWADTGWENIPVFVREALPQQQRIAGPALILDATGTLYLERDFSVVVSDGGRLVGQCDAASTTGAIFPGAQADPVGLEVFANAFAAIADDMGEVLRRTARSTNIRDRRDFSCAVFDAAGGLVANAPHIPVHLGAMSETVRAVMRVHARMTPGVAYASNDPAFGGSHLPDITVVTPVFDDDETLRFFVACRGHHADVGGISPGSMPPFSRRLDEEGVVFSAIVVARDGELDPDAALAVLMSGAFPARNPDENLADLRAQLAANRRGEQLLRRLWEKESLEVVAAYMAHVQANCAAQVAAEIARLPDGRTSFSDRLDDGSEIRVTISVCGDRMRISFAGSSAAVAGNYNAPRAVTMAAVIYVLRVMVATPIPLNSGCLAPVDVDIPPGSILDAPAGVAVAAGNVETSQRIVDVLLAALGLAAACQGTMNNFTFGNQSFGYYETIAGGAGATATRDGADAVHTHMTNTRITDAEILERRFPVRVHEFSIRRGSGGAGHHRGGDGVVREMEALEAMDVAILSERRHSAPFGLAGGGPGKAGQNSVNGIAHSGRSVFRVRPGDRIRIETPGGGGFGPAS